MLFMYTNIYILYILYALLYIMQTSDLLLFPASPLDGAVDQPSALTLGTNSQIILVYVKHGVVLRYSTVLCGTLRYALFLYCAVYCVLLYSLTYMHGQHYVCSIIPIGLGTLYITALTLKSISTFLPALSPRDAPPPWLQTGGLTLAP
jgi:hypothetical protein